MKEATIEPVPQGSVAQENADEAFILSRRPGENIAPVGMPSTIHAGEKWFPFRAQYLGIDESTARARDAAINEHTPPLQFWDEQTALETVSIWSSLCNECHGGRRTVQDVIQMPPPPATWGHGLSNFFGRERSYAQVFNTISNGGPIQEDGKPSQMPAWQRKLSKEQIWSLIYFVEFQSYRAKGRFPPSLYPRHQNETIEPQPE